MKKVIRDIKKHCINSHRLKFDKREQIGLEYLTDYRGGCGYSNQMEVIKSLLLCMNKNHHNYVKLHHTKKKIVEKLLENEDVVNAVICTLFQWFGTIVGRNDIAQLIKKIDSIDHTGKKHAIK
jgi:hypothetical protein